MNMQRLAVLYSNSYKILTQIRKEKNRMEWNGMAIRTGYTFFPRCGRYKSELDRNI